jgi:DNA-binding transcriptional LysR family regulator
VNELPHTEFMQDVEGVDWDDFRIFLEVVRSGSFNRAAVKLKMTQPTVSRRLARLEHALGVRLFDRDRRGPRLTTEGLRIHIETCTAQGALRRAVAQATGAGGSVEGDCKIFMGEGVATYWMSRFLAPFFTRHPNIELKVFGANDPAASNQEPFDLKIHYYEPTEIELIAVRLGTLHLVPFASREYVSLHGAPQSPEHLARHRLLDPVIRMSDMGSWASSSKRGTAAHVALFTNLTGCVAESVCHGAGIALLPTYAVLVHNNFVPLEIGIRYAIPIYVSYSRDAMKKWAVRAMLGFLRTCVFDKKSMPWFGDAYQAPEIDWQRQLAMALERATTLPEGDDLPANAAG